MNMNQKSLNPAKIASIVFVVISVGVSSGGILYMMYDDTQENVYARGALLLVCMILVLVVCCSVYRSASKDEKFEENPQNNERGYWN